MKKVNKILKELDTGTIVHIYENGRAYEIEFVDEEGNTIELVTLVRVESQSIDLAEREEKNG